MPEPEHTPATPVHAAHAVAPGAEAAQPSKNGAADHIPGEPGAQEHADWAVLGDHAHPQPESMPSAATIILPALHELEPVDPDATLFPTSFPELAGLPPPQALAQTVLMPAPEFAPQLRTPAEITDKPAAENTSEPSEHSADPNARTMILPAPDFTPAAKESAAPPPSSRVAPPAPVIPISAAPISTLVEPLISMAPRPVDAPPEHNETRVTEDASALTPIVPPPDFSAAAKTEVQIQTVRAAEPAEHSTPVLEKHMLAVAADAPAASPAPITITELVVVPADVAVTEVALPQLVEKQADAASAAEIVLPLAAAPIPEPAALPAAVAAPLAVAAGPVAVALAAAAPAVQNSTPFLAPPPDNPFGEPSDSSALDFAMPAAGRSSRGPAPSGLQWRSVMNEIPTAQPKPVLVATGLVKWFGKRQVVRGVDLEVGAGEIIGLLGRNGAGKTTTFRMIMGLLHPDGGRVTYENRDVTRLPMYARANRGIGYLAQNPSIFQRLSVEENLLAVLELQEPSRKIRKQRMEELIKSLGLEKVRLQQAAVLSGGERRRLEIARAMSLRPRIVLFDEPFAGIDPITVNEIQSILKDLKKQGVGVLITDHNVRETLSITDRTYIMDDGKIWIHGHPKEIVANEEARSRYLGHEFRLDF